MSERMFEAFREEAERLTEVPAFEPIEQRGRQLRRRRQAFVGSVAASVLAVTGILVAMGDEPRTQRPAEPAPARDEVIFLGVESPPDLTYERPADWENLGIGTESGEWHERNVAQFEATVAVRVAKDPCQVSRGALDFRTAATEPAPLAAQLASMARVRVLLGPVPDDRFGLPALHLRLRGTDPACTRDDGGGMAGVYEPGGFVAVQSRSSGGKWPDPLGVADLWLVDVGDQVVLIEAVTGRQVSAENRATLEGILDTVTITAPALD